MNALEELLSGVLDVTTAVLVGWRRVATRTGELVVLRARRLDRMQWAFLGSVLVLGVLTILPWVRYTATLQATESYGIGSENRLWFFLPAPLGLLFFAIGIPRRLQVFLGALILVAVLYIAGIVYPNPLHTAIARPEDYSLTVWLYLYGLFLVVVAGLARPALEQPLVWPADVRAYLLDRPAIERKADSQTPHGDTTTPGKRNAPGKRRLRV
ncbi:MAG: hypothetical protein H7A21_15960 [Spirochaetales bacterium]|nr:hypothetical protein [Leptospiraceae bacterium]MCP5482933.1 hypothetical protein [Spirochaetales bacterium]